MVVAGIVVVVVASVTGDLYALFGGGGLAAAGYTGAMSAILLIKIAKLAADEANRRPSWPQGPPQPPHGGYWPDQRRY